MWCVRAGILLSLLALAACQDGPAVPITGPEGPRMAISDAASGSGNPHFYFKPPMVPSRTHRGTFDPTLDVTVKICEWSATRCGTEIASFDMSSGRGSETVRVDAAEEHYIVNWHTGRFALDVGRTYRIRVLVDGRELGYADVKLYRSQKEAKSIDTGEYVTLKMGATLPIKFRIEKEGAALPGVAAQTLSSGTHHGCGISRDAAYCWGYNRFGQLGNGTTTPAATPVAVSGGLVFAQITTGEHHTCALDPAGAAYCWGYNDAGNLGRGSYTFGETTPGAVVGGHAFTQITAGAHHTCGLEADGTAWCWGRDDLGQLGDGTAGAPSATPVQVLGGPYRQIDGHLLSTCGVTTAGVGKCWGSNSNRQLGNAAASYSSATPVAVDGGHTFSQIRAGFVAGCGLRTDGQTLCWGDNQFGSLGQGTIGFTTSGPVVVTGGHTFRQIDVGALYACGILADGAAYCWGLNANGALGIGSTVQATGTPTRVVGTDTWASISTGWQTTCGVTTTGTGRCWGWNVEGQTGTGSPATSLTSPADIAGGLTFGS